MDLEQLYLSINSIKQIYCELDDQVDTLQYYGYKLRNHGNQEVNLSEGIITKNTISSPELQEIAIDVKISVYLQSLLQSTEERIISEVEYLIKFKFGD